MTIDNAGLMAAIEAGINGEPLPSTDAPAGEVNEETETPSGEEETSLETTDGDGAASEGEVGTEGQSTEGQQRGPDGKFLSKVKKSEAPAGETAEQKVIREAAEAAATGKKPAAAAKTKDPVNDPIPENLKQETKERMQGLVTVAKEQTQRAERAETQFNEIMGAITESTANPQQYGQALEYIRMVNTQDPAQLRKAITFMQKELGTLQGMLGEPVAGVDGLAAYPDLKQAVLDGTMSQQYADELAAARQNRDHRTHVGAQQTQQQQFVAVVDKARADMNALGLQLQTDPSYAAKLPQVKALFTAVKDDLHPSKWTAKFKQLWDAVPAPTVAAASKPAAPGVPVNQPMRARNPAGGATKGPANLFEAIDQGIAAAG